MSATVDAIVGSALPELRVRATNVQARADRASEENIHDDSTAQRLGFQRGFVAFGQSLGWMSRMLLDYFGPSYYDTGRFECRFAAPVFDDDDVAVRGEVRERVEEQGGVRLVCDVWIEKADGTRAVVGTASALVGQP
ncbi:MAG: MaoC family dehydratase [Chloroflexi bacterium]|nr:MaoC family dehydratase [Chloroflexota bacterium]